MYEIGMINNSYFKSNTADETISILKILKICTSMFFLLEI